MDKNSGDSPVGSEAAPYSLTRRRLLPLLAAAGAGAVSPHAFGTGWGGRHRPSPATARYVYVGTYTAPDVPPGGTHPSTAKGIYGSGWSRAMAT